MAQPHLINYVREQIKAGYSPDEIRTFLVGHGYPVRDIDEAIEQLQRPVAKAPMPTTEKKLAQVIAKSEAAKVLEEDFVDLFKIWFMALFMPGRVFPEEKDRASLSRAFMNVLISASLGGLIAGIIIVIRLIVSSPATPFEGIKFFGLAPITTVQQITVLPIGAIYAWLTITSFFYLFGILTGGTGTFERFAHFTSLFSAPLAFILGILSSLAFLPKCISFLTVVVFGAIGVYPMLYAAKETHDSSMGKAAIATLIPILLVLVLMVPAILRGMFGEICKF